jgi:hypothetical protein
MNYKLNLAASQRHNQLSAIQIKAKLHNELVQSRSTAAVINEEFQKLNKFSKMQEKLRKAAERRERNFRKMKNSEQFTNVA